MTIIGTPTLPVAGDTIKLSISGQTSDQYSLTSVPSLSALQVGLLTDANGDPTDEFEPDAAGHYEVEAHQVREFIVSPSYPGDPIGGTRQEFVALDTGDIFVGELMEFPIGNDLGDELILRVTVFDDDVQLAEFSSWNTEKARLASMESTVVTKLAALVGVAVTSVAPTFIARTTDLRAKYEAHRPSTTYHYVSGDTVNVMERGAADALQSALDTVLELHQRIKRHVTTIPVVPAATRWHQVDDTENVPVCTPVLSLPGAFVALADLSWRVYTRHLGETASGHGNIHKVADTTNTLTAITPLEDLIVAVLDALADQAPTAPDGEQDGAIEAANLYGFKKVIE